MALCFNIIIRFNVNFAACARFVRTDTLFFSLCRCILWISRDAYAIYFAYIRVYYARETDASMSLPVSHYTHKHARVCVTADHTRPHSIFYSSRLIPDTFIVFHARKRAISSDVSFDGVRNGKQ